MCSLEKRTAQDLPKCSHSEIRRRCENSLAQAPLLESNGGIPKVKCMNPSKKLSLNLILTILCVFWNVYYLAPILKSGYYADDALNSQVYGGLLHFEQTLGDYNWKSFRHWTFVIGRFVPSSFYVYPFFYYVKSLFIYKLVSLLVILADSILLGIFLEKLTNKVSLRFLVWLSLPVFFQIRSGYDPMTAFHFLVPLTALYLIGSLILFLEYYQRKTKLWLGLSLTLFFFCLTTYEASLLSICVFWGAALCFNCDFKKKLALVLPHTALWIIVVAIAFYLRSGFNPYYIKLYAASALNFDPKKVATSFNFQAVSALPWGYSYWVVGTSKLRNLLLQDYLIVSAFGSILFWQFLKFTISKKRSALISFIGLLWWLSGSLLISISGTQERILGLGNGNGYLSVFLDYFGCYLFLFGLYFLVVGFLKNRTLRVCSAIFVAVLICIIYCVNLTNGRDVVKSSNRSFLHPRSLVENSLSKGILAGLTPMSTIVKIETGPMDHFAIISNFTRQKWRVESPSEFAQRIASSSEESFYSDCSIKKLLSPPNHRCSFNFLEIYPKSPNIIRPKSIAGLNILRPYFREGIGFSYSADVMFGKRGLVFLAPIEQITIDLKSKNVTSVEVSKIKVFEQETGKIHLFRSKLGMYEFLPIIDRNPDIPDTLYLFKTSKFFDNLNDELE